MLDLSRQEFKQFVFWLTLLAPHIFFSTTLHADSPPPVQNPLTLEEAKRYAILHNHEIASLRHAADEAKARAGGAGGPSIQL